MMNEKRKCQHTKEIVKTQSKLQQTNVYIINTKRYENSK